MRFYASDSSSRVKNKAAYQALFNADHEVKGLISELEEVQYRLTDSHKRATAEEARKMEALAEILREALEKAQAL